MKKFITTFLIASIVFIISGCKTQKDLHTEDTLSSSQSIDNNSSLINDYNKESNDTESIDTESALSKPEASASQASQQSADNKQSKPAQASAPSSEAAACQHDYRADKVEASCTEEGHIVYTCTKCGNSYQETISARHDYSKYLCERCGKIDPAADKFRAMNAWLSAYGEPNGKGNMNCYPNDSASLSISNYLDQNTFFIDYDDSSAGVYFSVYVQGPDISTVSFRKDLTYGSYDIKNSALSSSRKIVFDEFYTSEENPVDEDVFATECAKKIDQYMLKAQNEIIYPKTGLKLNDFGFTYYQLK